MGAHLAYYFRQLNRRMAKQGKILYCGPSNKSVDVVAGMLLNKFIHHVATDIVSTIVLEQWFSCFFEIKKFVLWFLGLKTFFYFFEITPRSAEIGGFLDCRPFFSEITARLAEICGPASRWVVHDK